MNVEDDTIVFVIDNGARFHCTSAPSPESCRSTPHSAIYPFLYQALSEQPLTVEMTPWHSVGIPFHYVYNCKAIKNSMEWAWASNLHCTKSLHAAKRERLNISICTHTHTHIHIFQDIYSQNNLKVTIVSIWAKQTWQGWVWSWPCEHSKYESRTYSYSIKWASQKFRCMFLICLSTIVVVVVGPSMDQWSLCSFWGEDASKALPNMSFEEKDLTR
jgi:hypothetical protein